MVSVLRDAVQRRGEGAHALAAATRPSACSSRSARLTVMRLTPNCATSSASDGISAPGGQRPLASPSFR